MVFPDERTQFGDVIVNLMWSKKNRINMGPETLHKKLVDKGRINHDSIVTVFLV
jgi:hypothetical protein